MGQENGPLNFVFCKMNGLNRQDEDVGTSFDRFLQNCDSISMRSLVTTVLHNYDARICNEFLDTGSKGFYFDCKSTKNPQTNFSILKGEGRVLCGRPSKENESGWELCYQYQFDPKEEWKPVSLPDITVVQSDEKQNSADATEFAKSVLRERAWKASLGREIDCAWEVDGFGWIVRQDPEAPGDAKW